MKIQNNQVSFNGAFRIQDKKAAKYLTNILPQDYQNRVLDKQESKEVKDIFRNFYKNMSKLAKSLDSNKNTRGMDIVLVSKADLEKGTYEMTPAFIFTKTINTIKTKYVYEFLPDKTIDSLNKTRGQLDSILEKAKKWVEELKIPNETKKINIPKKADDIVENIFKV